MGKKVVEPAREVLEIARKLYRALDTPRSLTAEILLRHGEWDQLVQLKTDPRHYIDSISGADRFKRDYQASEFLRKYPSLPTKIDTRQVAYDGFWASEAQCKRTNDRLDYLLDLPTFDVAGQERILDFIQAVKKEIAGVLGSIPEQITPRFGPGATFESKTWPNAKRLVVGDKMRESTAVTTDAQSIFEHYFWPCAWGRAHVVADGSVPFRTVPGNRFVTVPKDATKDRGICIEPGGNVWLQLGIGAYLKRRLFKCWGYEISGKPDWIELWMSGESLADAFRLQDRDSLQQQRHKALACDASLSGEFATIDLSSASDTVAWKLVKLLLPVAWFDLLDALRSRKTLIDGRWVRLEKFSSMGNGFTFELETLIFAAIAKVASGSAAHLVNVYGDDIIVPTDKARTVVAALRYFGFTPNARKTFLDGAFRESCGGDFFEGQNVRPYYLKEEPNEPHTYISIANGLWRASNTGCLSRADRYFSARFTALGYLPADVRAIRGPESLGDLVVTDHRRDAWRTRWRNGILWCQTYRPISRRIPIRVFPPPIQLALALNGSPSSGLIPRNAVSGYKVGRASVS